MDVERKIKDMLSAVRVTSTPWEFVTSGGGELMVGTPVARVSVAGTVGAIWISTARVVSPCA
jgi:hypothetical protein